MRQKRDPRAGELRRSRHDVRRQSLRTRRAHEQQTAGMRTTSRESKCSARPSRTIPARSPAFPAGRDHGTEIQEFRFRRLQIIRRGGMKKGALLVLSVDAIRGLLRTEPSARFLTLPRWSNSSVSTKPTPREKNPRPHLPHFLRMRRNESPSPHTPLCRGIFVYKRGVAPGPDRVVTRRI